ncbi:PKD domain-containing protein [Pontibacter sp. G13]|uniref:PKD domain-containing protein n=1 Tax=Pontibacter sp. G13 TaxID=3074898 RepID=UPI00288A90B7|nr:PKD domain-containing protein [Pontibacter sp. G13]WNJ16592.1 PKD domain-containing protein [Pontibacter sp. G13]
MRSFTCLTKRLWFLTAILFSALPVSATHFMGIDVTYECIGTCTYRVYVNRYLDCSGSATSSYVQPIDPNNPYPAPGTFDFDFIGTPTPSAPVCNQPTAVGNWVFVNFQEVTPVCPTATTECQTPNGQLPGVAEISYYRDYDFCSVNCDVYAIETSNCCRNNTITSGAANNNMFVIQPEIDLNLTPCNSTPVFTNPPVPYICTGETFTFNQGAFDPDGDSLSYSLGPCYQGLNNQVGYNGGFSPTSPLGAGWTVTVDPVAGDITIAPNPTGPAVIAVLCLEVTEWRNGVQIGQVVRDIQVTAIDCSAFGQVNNSPTIGPIINNTAGSTVNGMSVTACACQEVCFDIPINDVDPGQNYMLYWNNAIAEASFADSLAPFIEVDTVFSGAPGDLPVARFCWVPINSGFYQFLLTAQDDGCPLFGFNQTTVTINVTSCSLDPYADANKVGCYDVEFIGYPCGGAKPFTYQWTGNGGLNATGDSLVHNYPGPGTYWYTLTITDSLGVSSSTTDTITLVNTATADAGPDLVICSGEVATIGTPALPGYTYQWSSPIGLGWAGAINPTTAQAQVSLNNQLTTQIPLTFYLASTDAVGCTDYDTVQVVVNPLPLAALNVAQPVCVDELTTVTFTAPAAPSALTTYHWNYDGGTGSSNGIGPHQVFWSTPGVKDVSVWVSVDGCPSDTVTQQVTINEIPTPTFITTAQICGNEAAIVQYTGTASNSANFIWDFDGGVGTGGAGPFTVTWASAGTKTITLQVEENGCLSPLFSQTVLVYPVPSASFSFQPSICLGDLAQITYTGSASSSAAYAWTFGDGQVQSGTGVGPYTLFWPTGGTKSVCLQVEENGCTSILNCQDVEVNEAPNVSIDPVANQCFNGNGFNFTISGDPGDNYQWNFGPSALPATSTSANPGTVVYQNPGLQTVSLVVTANGCVGDSALATFEVVEEPVADFQVSANSTCTDTCVTFTYVGGSSGPNTAFFWDFGPNAVPQTSTLENPPCVYFQQGGIQSVSLTVTRSQCTVSSTQDVSVYQSPVVSAGMDTSFCEGDGGVQLDASVLGGTTPYFYHWWAENAPNGGISNNAIEDPAVNPDIQAATETVKYYFQVTDVNGCASNIDSVEVTVKAKPKMDAGRDTSLCEPNAPGAFLLGGVAADNAAPQPIQPYWMPATGLSSDTVWSPYARPDTTTIYTLIGVSANGCASEATTLDTLSTVTITVNPKPVADAGRDTVLCFGESLQLQGFATEAGPGYSYVWTPAIPGEIDNANIATPTVTPSQTTTYTLSVESNGCVSNGAQVTVTVHTIPTVDAGNDLTLCLDEIGILEGGVDGDPNAAFYDFTWTPAIGLSDPSIANPEATPTSTQTYTLTATSQYGCGSGSDDVLVTIKPTPEVVALTPDTVICAGDTIMLRADHSFTTPSGGPVVYSWFPENLAVSNVFDSVVYVVPQQTTIFTVKTSIAANDCATTDEILVTVNPAINAEIAADTNRICVGEAVQLIGTGGLGNATFTWTPSLGLDDASIFNPVAAPNTSLTYQLLVSEGVCQDTATFSMEVNPVIEANYFASVAEGCAPLTVNFVENTTNGVAFRWNFGDESPMVNESSPEHVFEAPGEYTVSLITVGVGGCEDTASTTTVMVGEGGAAAFVSDAPADLRLAMPYAAVQFLDQSQRAVSWFWDFGDGTVSSEQNPSHQYLEEGSYLVTLTVTDAMGCVSTISYDPFEVFRPEVMIPTVFTPNEDGINDVFKIEYDGEESVSYVIFDRWGREVFSSQSAQDVWNGGDLPNGVYFYAVQIGEKVYKGDLTMLR